VQKLSSVKQEIYRSTRRAVEAREAFLAEGTGMVEQALSAKAPMERVFLHEAAQSEERQAAEIAASAGVPVITVTRGVFVKLLGLGYETTTRLAAVVRVPCVDALREPSTPPPVCLAAERIQDPRNVGVLMRTADAFAVPFRLSGDSAFAWSRQAVRSSTGSVFRVSCVVEADLAGWLRRVAARGVAIVGTSAAADTRIDEVHFEYPAVVLLGNESSGLSSHLRPLCDLMISIPMYGGAHSLNVTVAAGIVLNEVCRQLYPATLGRRDSLD
jgi:tRNA G18 (ribose-2'-O)-methylase SpoU